MATKFENAERKFAARRQAATWGPVTSGGRAQMNISILAGALKNVDIGEILPDDSRQTFAVGLYGGKSLIVANKGVKNGDHYAETIRHSMYQQLGDQIELEYTAGVEGGLHAEMAIVRHVLGRVPKEEQKRKVWDLAYTLQIFCVGKGVCPDCAGWLNKHKIPHLSLIKEKDAVAINYACGKPSQGGQWKHPRTGAFYQSENPNNPTLNTYQKNGQSYNRPL